MNAKKKKTPTSSSIKDSVLVQKALAYYDKHRFLSYCFIILSIFILIGLISLLILFLRVPSLNPEAFSYDLNAEILDKNGAHYQSLQGTEIRSYVKEKEIPQHVKQAFVDIEDERFYTHRGVDTRGLIRAGLGVMTSGGLDGVGGSTITQQLIKLTHLTPERTIQRKFTEIILAKRLERLWTKEQILESYLNKINLGGIYGVESAAKRYFGVSVKDLRPAQAAILAAIPKSPVYYHPYLFDENEEIILGSEGKPVLNEENQYRAGLVLNKMYELGDLSSSEYENAKKELENGAGLTVVDLTPTYSYFTDAVYAQLLTDLQAVGRYTTEEADSLIQSGGLIIHSTVDPDVQKVLEEQAQDGSLYPASSYAADLASEATGESYIPQSAMTLIDNETGAVLALQGGRGEKPNLGINRATSTFPTGSVTKPLTAYGPALNEKIVTLASVRNDTAIDWGGWAPKNAGGSYKGPISLRTGLSESVNTIAAQLVCETGINTCATYAEKLGLTLTDEDKSGGAALALGGYHIGQNTVQMAGAFSVFPRGGEFIKPYLYTKVEDRSGNVLIENKPDKERVYSEETSYLITSALKDAINGGSTYVSAGASEVAGKTGTTDSEMHAWFCGYTPKYTMAVWYGYDKNIVETAEDTYHLNIGIFGGSKPGPAAMFEAVMNNLPLEAERFKTPSGIVQARFDSISGLAPGTYTGQDVRTEYFAKDTVPTEKDNVHTSIELCKTTGKRKGSHCTEVETKTYLDLDQLKKVEGITYTGGYGRLAGRAIPSLGTCTDAHKPKEPEPVTSPAPETEETSPLTVHAQSRIEMKTGESLTIPIEVRSGLNALVSVDSKDCEVRYSNESVFVKAVKAGTCNISISAGTSSTEVQIIIR